MKQENKPMSANFHQLLINIFLALVMMSLFVKIVFL